MQFYQTPDNPVPGEPVLMTVTTKDGIPLRVARWNPPGPVQGTICILQGRAEFIEKYFETVGDLLVRGFAVVTFDWRGQGHSGRQVRNPRKGHIRSFRDYRKDLDAVRDHVLIPHMPEPHFALAHSMGGAIALGAAYEGQLPFRRLVTVAPMIALSIVSRIRQASLAAQVLYWLGFGTSFIPGGGETSIATKPFAGNRLTTDPVRYARNAAAAHAVKAGAIGDPTVSWIHAAFKLMRRFADSRYPLKIRMPTLIIAAGSDPVCSTPAIERFASRLKAGRAIVLPGARHEILMERDAIREQFWAAFDAFIPGTADPVFGETAPVLLAPEPAAPEATSAAVPAQPVRDTMLLAAPRVAEAPSEARDVVVLDAPAPEPAGPAAEGSEDSQADPFGPASDATAPGEPETRAEAPDVQAPPQPAPALPAAAIPAPPRPAFNNRKGRKANRKGRR